MKKKKYLFVSLIAIIGILIFTVVITSVNKKRTVNDLMSQLENAINSSNLEKVINLYPKYYRDTVSELLSQNKLNEFNNKIGEIKIEVVNKTNYDLSQAKDIQDKIYNNYDINLKIDDYQLLVINVTNNIGSVFEQSQLQIIKINGEYYLYTEYYLGDLIQCFVE